MSNPSIVVTGIGTTSPLGANAADSWSALLAGGSGARSLEYEWVDTYSLPVTFAAQVAVQPEEMLDRVEAKRLDRGSQFSLIAAREAWADAGSPEVEPERLAVDWATGIGGVWTLLNAWDTLREKGPQRVLPMTVPMLMPNGPAAQVGLELLARAGVHTPVSACSSGAEAVSYAMDMIRAGRADIVAAGGTEAAILPLPLAGFAAMQALSLRNDEPERASRPYDKGRDGFVLGEGAGILVLERLDHALARGARIYAEVAGSGISADAHHIAQPDPVGSGAARAMAKAVENAGGAPSDVVHINAHATSTPVGDVAEVRAIRLALGDATDGVAVSATKSMTGHLLGAAGAVESIATVLAVHKRTAPPTTNLEDLDDDVHLDVVRGEPRRLPDGDLLALNNSFGFGGHNVALAIRSFQP
jgi:3-oxoacyl-[acyl-carrier-protein] synthase II